MFKYPSSELANTRICLNISLIHRISKEYQGDTLQTDLYKEELIRSGIFESTLHEFFFFMADTALPLALIIEVVTVQVDSYNLITKQLGIGWAIVPLINFQYLPDIRNYNSVDFSTYLQKFSVCNANYNLFSYYNNYKFVFIYI